MIGDSAVGKTSLIERFAEDSFRSNFVSTIGVDFKIFTMKYQDKIIKFQIWWVYSFILSLRYDLSILQGNMQGNTCLIIKRIDNVCISQFVYCRMANNNMMLKKYFCIKHQQVLFKWLLLDITTTEGHFHLLNKCMFSTITTTNVTEICNTNHFFKSSR